MQQNNNLCTEFTKTAAQYAVTLGMGMTGYKSTNPNYRCASLFLALAAHQTIGLLRHPEQATTRIPVTLFFSVGAGVFGMIGAGLLDKAPSPL